MGRKVCASCGRHAMLDWSYRGGRLRVVVKCGCGRSARIIPDRDLPSVDRGSLSRAAERVYDDILGTRKARRLRSLKKKGRG